MRYVGLQFEVGQVRHGVVWCFGHVPAPMHVYLSVLFVSFPLVEVFVASLGREVALGGVLDASEEKAEHCKSLESFSISPPHILFPQTPNLW